MFPECGPNVSHHRYSLHNGDGDTFPLAEARAAAAALPLKDYACAILLGLNVARAFSKVGVRLNVP